MKLTAVFEHGEDGWINAPVLELPGANTCAKSMDEARELLADAVRELVASYAESEPLH
jgi:predicted RNase H-like HicB family nuclease